MRFYNNISYDNKYQGIVKDETEGLRLAKKLGDKKILFMRNHGVLIIGRNIHEAWDDLYYLEQACKNQILALSTNKPLQLIPIEICEIGRKQEQESFPEYSKLHFEAQKRIHLKII